MNSTLIENLSPVDVDLMDRYLETISGGMVFVPPNATNYSNAISTLSSSIVLLYKSTC